MQDKKKKKKRSDAKKEKKINCKKTENYKDLLRCKLCEAVFYSKKAWESHNMLHKPGDLYINKEEDRKLAVARIDQVCSQWHFNQQIDYIGCIHSKIFRISTTHGCLDC